ncbi:hypothetical protein CTAYLR_002157, partial [Chrysophaeum taylorii]
MAAHLTTLADLLLDAASEYTTGDAEALLGWSSREGEVVERVTFRDLLERGYRFAEVLARRGAVQAGERVAVLSHPTVEQFCALAGIFLGSQVAVMLNWRLPAGQVSDAIEISGPVAIVASKSLAPLCDAVLSATDRPIHRFDIVARSRDAPRLLRESPGGSNGHAVVVHARPGDCAVVMFTSGSTGPKGVPLTHANLVCACLGKLRAHERSGLDVASRDAPRRRRPTLSFLPNFHVGGLVNNFVFNVMIRIPAVVHVDCATARLTIDLLRVAAGAVNPVVVDTAPHLLEALARRSREDRAFAAPFARPGMLVLYSGAPLSSAASETLEVLGVRVAPYYGQTEFAGLVLIGEPGARPRGAMRPPPYPTSLRCFVEVEEDDNVLEPSGELLVCGSRSVTAGYLRALPPDPPFAETRATGDVFTCVMVGGQAWFQYLCRKDDVLVHTSGDLTVPVPLEDAAFHVFARAPVSASVVKRCVVVGQRRASPVLVLELADAAYRHNEAPATILGGGDILDRALADANACAPAYSHLRANRVLAVRSKDVPVSSKGTVSREDLERALESQLDALDAVYYAETAAAVSVLASRDDDDDNDDASPAMVDRASKLVADQVEKILGRPVADDVPLLSAGLTSADVVDLVRSLSSALEIDVSPVVVFDYPTRAQLARKLAVDQRRGGDAPICCQPISRGELALAAASEDELVAVAGIECRLPGGARRADLLRAILEASLDAVGTLPSSRRCWPTTSIASSYGAFLLLEDDGFFFDASAFKISPAEANAMDPRHRLVLENGHAALAALDARARGDSPPRDVGVFAALSSENLGTVREVKSTYDVTGTASSSASARLSFLDGLEGPCLVVDAACSSSMVAAHAAKAALGNRECAAALVPSANLIAEPPRRLAFLGLVSPAGRCHVFDDRADGVARAEGSVAVALAPVVGDKYAIDRAAAACLDFLVCVVRHNGRAASFVSPNGTSQAALVAAARRVARVDFSPTTTTTELHGTGTALGDPVEVAALTTLATDLRCGAVKANLGHGEAAAGAVGMLAAALALRLTLAPSAQLRRANPHIRLGCVRPLLDLDEASDAKVVARRRSAGASAFGWSGVIAHSIFAFEKAFAVESLADPYAPSLYRNKTTCCRRVVAEMVGAEVSREPPPPLPGDGLMTAAAEVVPEEVVDRRIANDYSPGRRKPLTTVAAARFVLPNGVTTTNALVEILAMALDACSMLPASRAILHIMPDMPAARSLAYGAFVLDEALFYAGEGVTPAPEAVINLDPRHRVLVREATAALSNANETHGERRCVGVYVGASSRDLSVDKSPKWLSSRNERDSFFKRDPYGPYTGSPFYVASSRISHALQLTGPCLSVDTEGSSSLVAAHLAVSALANGECDRSLAAGITLVMDSTESVARATDRLQRLSSRGRCFTFDARADGYVRGEGLAALVFEERATELVAGASAVQCDVASASLMTPNGSAQRALLGRVARLGGDIDSSILETHGASTALGDPIEIGAAAALVAKSPGGDRGASGTVLRLDAQSLKANIGHLERAAGAASVISVVCASLLAKDATVAPSAQLRSLNPHLNARFGVAFAAHLELAAAVSEGDTRVSSFGFSGTMAHARFSGRSPESWQPSKETPGVSLYRNLVPHACLRARGIVPALSVVAEKPQDGEEQCSYVERQSVPVFGEDVLKIVVAAAEEAVGKNIGIDETLVEVTDCDSTTLDIIRASVAESLRVTLPATTFFDYPTIRVLAEHLVTGVERDSKTVAVPCQTNEEASVDWFVECASVALPGGASSSTELALFLSRSLDASSTVPPSRWDAFMKTLPPGAAYGAFFLEEPVTPCESTFGMPAVEVESADPKQLMALTGSYAALSASRTSIGATAAAGFEKTAVFVGAAGSLRSIRGERAKNVSFAYGPTGQALAAASGRVSYALALQGPSVSLDTACSTGLVAVHLAVATLIRGESERALVTTVSRNEETAHEELAATGLLSALGKCHTLDARADGYCRGEGCVALVISSQQPDDDDDDDCSLRKRSYVVGPSAVQQDGRSASLTAPNGTAQRRLLRDVALRVDCDQRPRVALLEAHGTGTVLGDPVEAASSSGAFGSCNVSAHYQSLKANIGHLEPAAGAVGVVAVLEALDAAQAASCAQLRRLNPHLDPYFLEDKFAANVEITTAAFLDGRVSAFGFSGTIAHAQYRVVKTFMTTSDDDDHSIWRFDGAFLQVGPSLFRTSRQQTTGAASGAWKRQREIDAVTIVKSVVAASVGREIGLDELLLTAGLDSLALDAIRIDLEDKLGMALPSALLFDFPTIAGVVEYIDKTLAVNVVEQTRVAGSTSFVAIESTVIDMPGAICAEAALIDFVAHRRSAPSSVPLARWNSAVLGETLRASTTYGAFTTDVVMLDYAFFGVSPAEAIDPQQLRLLELSYAALRASRRSKVCGEGRAALVHQDCGVFAGASGAPPWRDDDDSTCPNPPLSPKPRINEHSALGLCFMAGRVSFALGLTGPSLALDTACSTTLTTLHMASNAVASRECSRAVSAGVVFLRVHASAALAAGGFLSARGRCHAFDSRADGYVRGEGCVVNVLETGQKPGGRRPLVGGTAVKHDGPSASLSAPNGSSQRKLLRVVVEKPVTFDELVAEAHGVGTMLGDSVEVGVIVDVLCRSPRRMVQCTSIKGNMGHLEAAAGAAGVANLLGATSGARVSPNAHLRNINPNVAASLTTLASNNNNNNSLVLPTEVASIGAVRQHRVAGRVNAFGYSGTIAHALILSGLPGTEGVASFRDGGVSLFRTAAPFAPLMHPTIGAIQTAIAHGDIVSLPKTTEELSSRRAEGAKSRMRSRAAIIARRRDVRATLTNIFADELSMDLSTASLADADSISITQVVSSINDAFAIKSEVGAYVVLDELDQTVSLVDACVAATPLPEEEKDDGAPVPYGPAVVTQRLRNTRRDVEVDNLGSLDGGTVIFVHDETGTCAYVRDRLHGCPQLALSRTTVVTIQAPELGEQTPTSRITAFGDRVDLYEARINAEPFVAAKLALRETPVTVVGCGAAVAIGRALSKRLEGAQFVAVDPSDGLAETRSALRFAKRFYGEYCCALLWPTDEAYARAALAAPTDQTSLRAVVEVATGLPTAVGDDLEEMCAFAFHLNATNFHRDSDDDADIVDETIVHTVGGRKLYDSGFRRRIPGDERHQPLQEVFDALKAALGVRVAPKRRVLVGYVPFVNRMDQGDCLKCWKKPAAGAPSVIFVHGGIGVMTVAANYIRKLPADVGLYVVQAPEHQTGDYDWAPTPKQRAERYLRVLMDHVPNGGVFVGYSFAGNVVFELALLRQEQRVLHARGGPFPYPFEFFLIDPVPPSMVSNRVVGESLLEHNARFVEKILAEEFLPAVFEIEEVIRLDAVGRVKRGLVRTNTELLRDVVVRVGLDDRFAVDFERMMEFSYNLKLEKPTGIYVGDVDYLMILPDGYRHYELYWSYSGDLAAPWQAYVDGTLYVHKTLKGNHFQAFDTESNMDNVKAICDPLLDNVKAQLAARHAQMEAAAEGGRTGPPSR